MVPLAEIPFVLNVAANTEYTCFTLPSLLVAEKKNRSHPSLFSFYIWSSTNSHAPASSPHHIVVTSEGYHTFPPRYTKPSQPHLVASAARNTLKKAHLPHAWPYGHSQLAGVAVIDKGVRVCHPSNTESTAKFAPLTPSHGWLWHCRGLNSWFLKWRILPSFII